MIFVQINLYLVCFPIQIDSYYLTLCISEAVLALFLLHLD